MNTLVIRMPAGHAHAMEVRTHVIGSGILDIMIVTFIIFIIFIFTRERSVTHI